MAKKWQNGEKMGSKWRKKWQKNGEKMVIKWQENGDKNSKWR